MHSHRPGKMDPKVIGVQEAAPVDQVCWHGSANALRLPGLCSGMQCKDNAKQAEAHTHTHTQWTHTHTHTHTQWPGAAKQTLEMATHSSILAWTIPWSKEPGGLQSMGSQRVGHDWVTNTEGLWVEKLQNEHLTGARPSHSQSLPLFHLRPQGNQIEAMKLRHQGHDDHQHGSMAVVGPVKALAWWA